ncbi:S8 family serine peptidase [Rugosimonospora africana]|nr:S8 family serine peptidase [Rugosimonospora africana]
MNVRRKYRLAVGATATVGLVLAASPGVANAVPAPTPALSSTDRHPVIVVLKNQHPELNAKTARKQRQDAAHKDQAPLVDSARKSGASSVKSFSIVNGFSAKLSSAEIAHLDTDPSVAAVVPDRMVPISPLTDADKSTIKSLAGPTAPADHVLPGSCPTDPSKPLLEPEALQTTHTAYESKSTPQAQNLVDGSGVKVAWIADGLDPNNPDFIRADGSHVFTDYQDFSGTDPNLGGVGAEAFGDASAIASQGRQVYDVSKFVNDAHPLPAGCNITVRGMAPGASLVGINVFGSAEFATNSVIIQAIDYAVNVANVDVINESFGGNPYPTDGTDPTALADDAAVAAGITVVASSGDAGPTNTIGTPAADPNVISVGATTTYRAMAQVGYSGSRNFGTSWVNGNPSALSSSGITDRGRTIDLVAPGEAGWAVCTPDLDRFAGCAAFNNQPSPIEFFGGTSQSSPFVAGGAALVIEAYKNTHHGVRPAPALVKKILTSTATDLGLPAQQQGAGEMDTYRAVREAMSIKDGNGSPAPQGDGLVLSSGSGDTQLTAVGDANSTQDLTLKVTNTSPDSQVVNGHGRILGKTLSDVKSSIAVDMTSTTGPSFADGINGPAGPTIRDFSETTFTVPAGADHLTGQFAWPGGTANGQSAIRVAVIGPHGEYEDQSYPQGNGNHGTIDVRYPAPGKWTAVFMGTRAATGFHGSVSYEFTSTRYVDFGQVSPSRLTLKPGQTGTLHVKVKLPDSAGDLSAAVQLDTASHNTFSVPVTLRSLLSTKTDGGAFHGTVTGGNGRGNPGAQTQAYFFDVPKGKADLGIDLTLAKDPNQQVSAALMGPDGQVLSLSTNLGVDNDGDVTAANALQGYVRAPAAGRWTLFINVNNPTSGTALAEPFTGHLRYDTVDVKASGVPGGKVAAGKPVTVTVKVRNTGAVTQSYFADPRLTASATYPLQALPDTDTTVALPFDATAKPPAWVVPTESTNLTVRQSSTIPADFDLSTLNNGAPELYGASQGLTAIASLSANRVSQGPWGAAPTPIGPTNGPVSGSASLSATVKTQAFDGAATSSTGDFWLTATQAQSPAFAPLVLRPGQSGTITVTVTPTGAKGSKVSGVLYLDTFSSFLFSGDDVAAVPYSYTIK